jgi:DNA-nicking Smr family endonuclease
MYRVNIEAGMPTTEAAARRLESGITSAKRQGINPVKVIHGYGASGTGGAIKASMPGVLNGFLANRFICGFIPGERWGGGDDASRALVLRNPELRDDTDYGKGNLGITIVLLK